MSSPRQKMVVVVPNELEQKKKRQTLERAKANHLSKQLQMRLQYAKLKVEHGWQRQNLNEVENLYFHHSHQRSMRQGAGQRVHYATVTYPPGSASTSAETHAVHSPAPSRIADQTVGSSSLTNDASSSGSVSPPSQSPLEHTSNVDGPPLSQPQPCPAGQTSMSTVPPSTMTNRPPSALDLSDPNILARLAQLQAQVQLPLQSQAQALTLSRHPSIPPPSSTSASASQSTLAPVPAPTPIPAPGIFSSHVQFSEPPTSHPQAGFALSFFAPQPLGTPTSGSVPLFSIPAIIPNNNNPTVASQTALISTSTTAPILTASIPTTTSIAPSALTYDSFWSTHASSTGPTRALYRTHTGFTASATQGGNVAMLTPGGNAAVMTAEGVYVGGGSK